MNNAVQLHSAGLKWRNQSKAETQTNVSFVNAWQKLQSSMVIYKKQQAGVAWMPCQLQTLRDWDMAHGPRIPDLFAAAAGSWYGSINLNWYAAVDILIWSGAFWTDAWWERDSYTVKSYIYLPYLHLISLSISISSAWNTHPWRRSHQIIAGPPQNGFLLLVRQAV